MNKFVKFAYWWYKVVLGGVDKKMKIHHAIIVLVVMFTCLFLSFINLTFIITFCLVCLPFMLISFYSTLFSDKYKFDDKLEFDDRTDKINDLLDE